MLTAEHHAKLAAAGFSDSEIADTMRVVDVAVAMGMNWQKIFQDILKYGPAIVAEILTWFNLQPTPAPTPTP